MAGQVDFGRGAEEFWEADAGTHPHGAGLSKGWKSATYLSYNKPYKSLSLPALCYFMRKKKNRLGRKKMFLLAKKGDRDIPGIWPD